ncbi:helix-turn-helix domain-containing protein [Deinococcus rubellus]|uniref:FeoC-like transcriptional regulator n=1 Tax=Deinococcus rubellus TaxID=1889240 RepID=A0ABY5YKR4_9DEIO|nr:FeoC-like transcriptional regulator [Deinococcus rubellus]UWX65296.1 FeoC-like transcriptional regulator [Deinococcus rubellus]
MTSPLATILGTLVGNPRTLPELSRHLGSSPEALEGMLRTLYAGGYVQEAVQNQGDCSCNGCSLKSMCRNFGDETPEFHLLRLTERGEKYLKRIAPQPVA